MPKTKCGICARPVTHADSRCEQCAGVPTRKLRPAEHRKIFDEAHDAYSNDMKGDPMK